MHGVVFTCAQGCVTRVVRARRCVHCAVHVCTGGGKSEQKLKCDQMCQTLHKVIGKSDVVVWSHQSAERCAFEKENTGVKSVFREHIWCSHKTPVANFFDQLQLERKSVFPLGGLVCTGGGKK